MSLAGLCLSGGFSPVAAACRKDRKYSIVMLGDTHFDAFPASVYHSAFDCEDEKMARRVIEFNRNGSMWEEHLPRILKRASRLVDSSTKMFFQTGDLIQGDCGSGEVHKRMLGDAVARIKQDLSGLPFVTVVGNHDIRGLDAKEAYHSFMPGLMSMELGKRIEKTTFSFGIGDDVFIFIDFNEPDDSELEKLLDDSKGARHTFIVSHGPVLPFDANNGRWIFHGDDNAADNEARRHFRRRFAERNAMVICGHTHKTEFADWHGDGGRITQMTINSVWSQEEFGRYVTEADTPEQYGMLRVSREYDSDGKLIMTPILKAMEEYKPGLRRYSWARAAGCCKFNVSGHSVSIDFYAGDSDQVSHQFKLR